MFDNFNSDVRKNCVRISSVFPRTENIVNGRKPVLETEYECTGNICEFNKTLNDIRSSVELKSYDQIKMGEDVYDIISKDQDFYLTSKVDNISLHKNGFELIRAKRISRETADQPFDRKTIEKPSRSCYIEMNTIRQQSLIYNNEKLKPVGFFNNPAFISLIGGATIGCVQYWIRYYFGNK